MEFFSLLGKTLEEKFNLRRNLAKKRLGRNLFLPDKDWEIKNYLCDNSQIKKECDLNIEELKKTIKLNSKEKKNKIEIAKEKENENKKEGVVPRKVFKSFKYRYHNIHANKIEKMKEEGVFDKLNAPHQTLYRPNYEYLYKKIITGPKWDNLSERKNIFNEQKHVINLSYNDTYFHKDNIKGYVNMLKQTERKGIINDINYKKELNKKNKFDFKTSIDNKENHPFLLVINDGGLNVENNILKKKKKMQKKYISAPDFNRYMSRDQNKLSKKGDKIVNGEVFPNYNSVESRIKMMVFYNKSRNHKLKDNRALVAFNVSDTKFDPNKTFEKIYGNRYKVVPNFEKMTSRKKNELPFFLNGLTDRNIFTTSNAKSLKMNNYSSSKMFNLCNDLKKDFNRYKNKKMNEMRKCFSYENIRMYDKKRVLDELNYKIKIFNKLVSNKEVKNDFWK